MILNKIIKTLKKTKVYFPHFMDADHSKGVYIYFIYIKGKDVKIVLANIILGVCVDSFKLQHFGQQRSNICFISVDIFVWKCTGIIVLEINEHITSGN